MLTKVRISLDVLIDAYRLMCTAKEMAALFEAHKDVTAKYVHATSRGHEAIQLALSMQLLPQDYVAPYYRDDSILLGLGMTPFQCMLQLLARKTDPFSGGRTYYAHPSLREHDKPKIPHQSSSTGMQAIPMTGVAHGFKYMERTGLADWSLLNPDNLPPVAVCSLGDAAITEGEVSEAFQEAVLHQLPILYLIQDNQWDISAHSEETRAQNAFEFAQGFKGLEAISIDGSDFMESYGTIQRVLDTIRRERRPFLVHAEVPLLNHHTSGVRKEWYRSKEDLKAHSKNDPCPKLRNELLKIGIGEEHLLQIEDEARNLVADDYQRALAEPEPGAEDLHTHIFAPTPITEERGIREPAGAQEIPMVDAALYAMDQLLAKYPEALLFGQDVGGELGGVFREAATLAKKYGETRVFNTPIQEAYLVGSTVGMSAVGLKPVVEVQFADYIWPGVNQLYAEVSRSCYLSNGKWPVQMLLRVPIGAYGSGGPFHSSSVESAILTIKGIKVVYPSNAADMKGLFKSAFLDPNPVVLFEHKGLYWGKVPGSREARCTEPDDDYIIPIGMARIYLAADEEAIENGESCVVVTYGMGVHWAKNAARTYFPGRVEVLDLRSLQPYDWEMIRERVSVHGKAIVLTEECVENSFAQSIAGRISEEMFEELDAPVRAVGAEVLPAIPLNSTLEGLMLPNAEKFGKHLEWLLQY
ncbi:MAG: hypothetical protein RLZZ165_574 [Bacteroidota bacterium]